MAKYIETSLKNTKELKRLIIDNPELPLLIFASEDANIGNASYEQANVSRVSIEKLALYNEQWFDEEDYAEEISYQMSMDDDFADLSDEEFEKAVDEKIKNTEFVKAIVIYVG